MRYIYLSLTTVRRILHYDLTFQHYKIQIVQELKPTDYMARLEFCENMMEKINGNPTFIESLLMSDKGHFHINKQNNSRYWASQNPRDLHVRPLHSPKVTMR